MAVQYFGRPSGSGCHVLAGFESGHLVHWDTRNPSVVVSSIKLFDEPGVCVVCMRVYVHACVNLKEFSIHTRTVCILF